MKILLALHELDRVHPGGVQTHVLQVARELRERGHRVSLAAGTAFPAACGARHDGELDGFPLHTFVRRARSRGLGSFAASVSDGELEARFVELVRQMEPDLVHFHHLVYLSMGLPARLLDLGWPALLTVHDHWLACHRLFLVRADGSACAGPGTGLRCGPCLTGPGVSGLAAAPAFWLRNRHARRAASKLPVVLSPSRYLARFLEANGVPARSLRVLPPGTPPAGAFVARTRSGPPVFAFAGTLMPHKGAHVALEAFSRLPPGSARLRIHGDPRIEPSYGSALAKRAEEVGAELAPPFATDDIDRALGQVDCIAIPSLAAENAPMLLRECLVRRLPVLASSVGGMNECASEGEGAHFFPPGDAGALAGLMLELAGAPDRLDALSAAARRPPSVQEHAIGLLEIYAELLAARGRAAA